MDFAAVDATIQAIIGRSDFVGGIDNEALDFSQLEAFINSGDGGPEAHSATASYFADSLQSDVANTTVPPQSNNGTTASPINRGKLATIDNKSHHLPESPPDSGSEHPYSPAETTDNQTQQQIAEITLPNAIYTTLGGRVSANVNVQMPSSQPTNNGLFKHHISQPSQPQASNNTTVVQHIGGGGTTGADIMNPLMTSQEHIMLRHPVNHHQMIVGNNVVQQNGRCIDNSQRCVLIQTNGADNQNQLLQNGRRDQNMVDIVSNRTDYNSSDFKLPLGHELEAVMMQTSPIGPPRAPRRDSNLTEIGIVNRNDYTSLNNRTTATNSLTHNDLEPVMSIQSPINGSRVTISTPLTQIDTNLENMQAVYTNLQSVSKKRKLSQDIKSECVKSEPELSPDCSSRPAACSPLDTSDEYSLDVSVSASVADSNGGPGSTNGNLYVDGSYQCIQFKEFQENSWHYLTDHQKNILPIPFYKVDADKGFNFSNADDAFVCQKKNHFQITCQIQLRGEAHFVKVNENHFEEIVSFHLHFYGVKYESPDQEIKVEQSQSDRSKKPFYPVFVDLSTDRITKVTVGRLHFSETTSNNMRKKGKPNPEQRYFQLVVGLYAHISTDPKVKPYPITLLASNRIIVRASNPGQFESDVEPCWQKGTTNESIYHAGKVGINTDRPDEALVIHGNLKLTGHIVQPSDLRAKQNIKECNTAEQLQTVKSLRLVRYEYQPEFASYSGLDKKSEYVDVGVIAQEVAQVLPEAVSSADTIFLPNGKSIDNILVVNKERIFMESVGAVKELCKVTNNLENRIVQLERMNQRLNKFKRGDSLKSNISNITATTGSNSLHKNNINMSKCIMKPHNHRNTTMSSPSDKDFDNICSNKVIQITIVVLVIIMALCLAAITTLYFIELQNHTQRRYEKYSKKYNKLPSSLSEPSLITTVTHSIRNLDLGYIPNVNNIKPRRIYPKAKPVIKDNAMPSIYVTSRENELKSRPSNSHNTESTNSLNQNINLYKYPVPIGRPAFCNPDSELDTCQTYCCQQDLIDTYNEENIDTVLFNKNQANEPKTQSNETNLFNKEKITKQINVNNLSKKEIREKRDIDLYQSDWADIFSDSETLDNNIFEIIIQGKHFNTSLGGDYCVDCSVTMNLTYNVPISKYMPDEFIYINFQNLNSQSNLRELEFCYNNTQQSECDQQSNFWNEQTIQKKNTKESLVTQIDEKNGFRTHGRRFEIDMNGVLKRALTYRVSLVQNNQNVCDLPASKLGVSFLEYNFNFYRDCEE